MQAPAEFTHGQQGDGWTLGQTLQPSGLIGVGVVAALHRRAGSGVVGQPSVPIPTIGQRKGRGSPRVHRQL